jgi:hypothetical protein
MSSQVSGACAGHEDPDLWFSDTTDSIGPGRMPAGKSKEMITRSLIALAICKNCPIQEQCLQEGLKDEHIDNGIWGGKLSGERIQMTRTNIRAGDRLVKIAFARRVRELQKI